MSAGFRRATPSPRNSLPSLVRKIASARVTSPSSVRLMSTVHVFWFTEAPFASFISRPVEDLGRVLRVRFRVSITRLPMPERKPPASDHERSPVLDSRTHGVTSVADAVVTNAVVRNAVVAGTVVADTRAWAIRREASSSPTTPCQPNQVIKDPAAAKARVLVLVGDPVATGTHRLGGLQRERVLDIHVVVID